MKHLFIINPKTFELNNKLDYVTETINNYFKQHTNKSYDIYISRYPRDAVTVIRKFVISTKKTVRVYAVGGDGILFDCLNGIIGTKNTELASIPYSSPNSFLRSFGQPNFDVFRDIEKQVNGNPIYTDVMNCGNNYALNFCTIGVEAAANKIVKDTHKKTVDYLRFKFTNNLFYISTSIMALLKKDLTDQYYEICIDGKWLYGQYLLINIANSHCYSNSFVISKDASPNDGFIDVTLVKKCSFAKQLKMLPHYIQGLSHLYPKYIIQKKCKTIEIRSSLPLYLDLDGEVFFDNTVNIQVEHKAIKFVVPSNLKYVNNAGDNYAT